MATIGATYLDIIDVLNRSESDDAIKIAKVIEMLKNTNSMLADAMVQECNLGTRHRTTLRTKLPTGSWGQLYQGTASSKSGTTNVEDATGFYEQLSSIDTRMLELAGGQENKLRLSEAKAHLEAISQEIQSTLIYGNQALEPLKFTGFAPRFNSLSGGTGGQIVDAQGSGNDNTSVWFVTWGDEQSFMLYPKGTMGGVTRMDKGEQRVLDDDGNPYYVKEELFRQHGGLAVSDYRYVARIANIDVSLLQAGSVDIYKFMRKAFWKIKRHRLPETRMAIYCNADVLEALDAETTPTASTTTSFVRLKPSEVDGQEVLTYRGIPVRQVDAILKTEAQVT